MLRDKTEVRILGNTKIRRKDSESESPKRSEKRPGRQETKVKKGFHKNQKDEIVLRNGGKHHFHFLFHLLASVCFLFISSSL